MANKDKNESIIDLEVFQCENCYCFKKHADGYLELIKDGWTIDAICCSKKCMKEFVANKW
ncbi:MAG: hypothetical protein FK730_08075 [Asgard group archaeon]|nr:hypothetical protein [Asgard group archaeon]